jgi:hypothetical protein
VEKFKGEHVEVREGSMCNFRKATSEELKPRKTLFMQIQKARAEKEKADKLLTALLSKCDHLVFYDEPGYIYHTRWCATCKKYLASI